MEAVLGGARRTCGPGILAVAPRLGDGESSGSAYLLGRVPGAGGVRNYCVTTPSSVGPGATMAHAGSTSVSSYDFLLRAEGCPPGQLTLFLLGTNQAQAAVGNGTLCVAPFRRLFPVGTSSPAGTVERWLDYLGLTDPIWPTSTWNFQLWYRDPDAGGAGYDFSDGLEVVFCP